MSNASLKYLHVARPFPLESGAVLPELRIAYTTLGELDAARDNVIWICHALTANADPSEWWPGLVGRGKLFDPERYFIVCANMLGSCYGTTGPWSIDPVSGTPYRANFPLVTIRDMVRAHELLRLHLGIERVKLSIGGSMGGQQVLEWAIMAPEVFQNIALLATNARHSPWGIAFNEAQRMAILADSSLNSEAPEAGWRGLEAARAIAMLSYRHYRTYGRSQSEEANEKIDDFRASSYQRYQGLKLRRRFDVFSYLTLSKAMDSHNVGRGRGGVRAALRQVKARALVVGIQSDMLFPVEEQMEIADAVLRSRLELIDSHYGHDGFLVEDEAIGQLTRYFLSEQPYPFSRSNFQLNGVKHERLAPRKLLLPGSEGF
jgi:homoserine O-acetyltransferase